MYKYYIFVMHPFIFPPKSIVCKRTLSCLSVDRTIHPFIHKTRRDMTTDTNAFEAARAARIEENKRRMAEMGIASLAAPIMMRTPTPTKKRVRVRYFRANFMIEMMCTMHCIDG